MIKLPLSISWVNPQNSTSQTQQHDKWAGRALTRARLLRNGDEPVVGLACTAAIITDRPKLGAHRAHIATWQNERVNSYSLLMEKGRRDRNAEESLVSRVMINALAHAYGLKDKLPLELGENDKLIINSTDLAASARDLLAGDISFFGVNDTGQVTTSLSEPPLLLSGSFNPLHDGHLELGRVASEMTGQPIIFELSALCRQAPLYPSA